MIRLGLCCIFRSEPIKFVTTTATAIGKLKRPDALAKLSRLCMANADALLLALQFCADNGIGCIRVNSQILPLKTHPTCGYEVEELPDGDGAYGDKQKALAEFARNLDRLSSRARRRLTVENDDKIFTPADLLPICKATGVPLVYDVHHHRCNPDGLSVEQATKQAMATWDREPLFHISSPREGWDGPKPERHHDFIDVNDFPNCWRRKTLTVEVEAKAKEVAVKKLQEELSLCRK